MIYQTEYTHQAENDILRNASWWAENHSLDQALEFDEIVRKQIATLAEMPERFGFAPEHEKSTIGLRQMMVGLGSRPSYRAIYTATDTVIHILAVRRASQSDFTP